MDKEKDVVFQEPLDNFKKNSLPYLSKSSFPCSPALSEYRDIEKNSHKYSSFVGENHSPDRPVGKSPAVAEPFSWRKPNSMILRKVSIRI
jgi:hypothetical protein